MQSFQDARGLISHLRFHMKTDTGRREIECGKTRLKNLANLESNVQNGSPVNASLLISNDLCANMGHSIVRSGQVANAISNMLANTEQCA